MKTSTFRGRDWIDAEYDFSREQWETLIDLALELKRRVAMGEDHSHLLKGKTLFTMFFNQSLRTRSSFEVGIHQLGGHATMLDTKSIYTPARVGFEIPYKTERISDVARVLQGYGDALAIRMYGGASHWVYGFANSVLKEFAEYMDIPVINMEDDKFHPCQALADMMTVKEKLGGFRGKKLVMSWAYSGSVKKPMAVPQSVVLSAAKMGMDVVFARPKGFELDPEVIEKTKEFAAANGATFEETEDMDAAFEGADVVYPKSFGSLKYFAKVQDDGTITEPDIDGMTALFEANKHWICDAEKMKLAKPGAIYMHCLPADRGMEVTDEVIDGPQSVVFDEAENRLHAQKAIMVALMGGKL